MDELRKSERALPRLPILGQPFAAAHDGELNSADDKLAAKARVPSWVHDEEVLKSLGPEFADRADLPPEGSTRRQFLRVMGASVALASTSGCFSQPQEKIVPYVRPPEQLVPGKPLYYATAMTLGGASLGLLVETHMGRPTKVEGNPLHPAVPPALGLPQGVALENAVRVGATDAYAQAVVLSLYDPDRSQTIRREGQISTWDAFYTELRAALDRVAPNGGAGLRLLSPPIVSPTLASKLEQLLAKYPNARLHQYEPINDDNAVAGAQLAFGEPVTVNYIGTPEIVLSLDADLFGDGPMRLQLARRVRGQVPSAESAMLPRLYVAETSATITGAAADHRLAVSAHEVVRFAVAIARRLGLATEGDEELGGNETMQKWVDAVADDLANARGRSVVIAGRNQPPIVHAIAHWINGTLGNVGQTVEYRAPTMPPVSNGKSIAELATAMQAKEVQALIILGGNPGFDTPADFGFAKAIANVPFSAHLSTYMDETSSRCTWHVPESHLFEAWGDTRATDGTASIVQPLIAPLYESKTAYDLVAAALGTPTVSSHDVVRAYWATRLGSTPEDANFERMWETALHYGVIAGTASEVVMPSLAANIATAISEQTPAILGATAAKLQISFRPDPSVWDGRFANNSWLQELQRPFTTLTWDNAALISPRTAGAHRVKTGDIVEIRSGELRLEIPAFVVPVHPDQTITLQVGYGRKNAGRVGTDVGTDIYSLRTAATPWFADVTSLRNTGRTSELAVTQHHHRMDGRDLVRAGTLAELRESPEHPQFMETHGHGNTNPELSVYPQPVYEGNKWGMVINQSACIACNACVVACQSENNIPVVGKDQVSRGREMHWLRIDGYYHDSMDESANPSMRHQPLLCMHCEYAPCEPVCPVAATTHSAEGLNEMTYNRCIGTRYCSNNCPYKVRRFNFFDYNAELRTDETMQLRPNPDVTIRSRGVMEKCTFCVQRINAGRIAADIENRPVYDGEILTACQAACPTQVFTFGNLNDTQSHVRGLADHSLNYSLLGELNTRPRVTYLAMVRNPNPALAKNA